MKAMFGRFYWLSLRGIFDPIFDSYFVFTKPKPAPEGSQTEAS
jgi:hypothetical protein